MLKKGEHIKGIPADGICKTRGYPQSKSWQSTHHVAKQTKNA
ncbi:hypothetical protein [Mucilaginibacter sp.]